MIVQAPVGRRSASRPMGPHSSGPDAPRGWCIDTASSAARLALLSAASTVRPSLVTMPSTTRGRTPRPGSTVSICALIIRGGSAGRVPGNRISRLPAPSRPVPSCSPTRRARNSIDMTPSDGCRPWRDQSVSAVSGGAVRVARARRRSCPGGRRPSHARQAGAAIALLVEVCEEGIILVEEPPDPEPIDVDGDVAKVGQRLQRRPRSFPGRLTKLACRRSLYGAPHDAGRRPYAVEDRAMLRAQLLPPSA
jgi:hypothetical protein